MQDLRNSHYFETNSIEKKLYLTKNIKKNWYYYLIIILILIIIVFPNESGDILGTWLNNFTKSFTKSYNKTW